MLTKKDYLKEIIQHIDIKDHNVGLKLSWINMYSPTKVFRSIILYIITRRPFEGDEDLFRLFLESG